LCAAKNHTRIANDLHIFCPETRFLASICYLVLQYFPIMRQKGPQSFEQLVSGHIQKNQDLALKIDSQYSCFFIPFASVVKKCRRARRSYQRDFGFREICRELNREV